MKNFMLVTGAATVFLSLIELINIIIWHYTPMEERIYLIMTENGFFKEELFMGIILLAMGLLMLTASILKLKK